MLKVNNLEVFIKNGQESNKIINNISFNVKEKRCLGILGESGSGKSITCKAILGLLNKDFEIKGEAIFKGQDILTLSENEKRKLRGNEIAMIVQNPMTAFNPLYTVGNQVIETFIENMRISKKEARDLAIKSFEKMNLKNSKEILKKYPHELSGGMLQRIIIGITIFLKPYLIIADEPTTAVDSLNQREIIEEFLKMKRELNTSMIFITHDLGVLSKVADDIIVMNKGEIIEYGSKEEIILNPQNEHTKFLVDTRLKLLRKFKQIVNARREFMLLEVKNIEFSYGRRKLKRNNANILKNVSFSLNEGECLGLIGESGSGKSTLGRIILGLEKQQKGTITFNGVLNRDIWQKELNVVFQDYTTSVNPRFKVIDIIKETLLEKKLNREELEKKVIELLEQVGLNKDYLYRYPHELSGGQLQRVCITRAISQKPKFILLDEAISSLDVSVQVQVLDLLIELKEKYNLSYLFITHDLSAVTYICDKVMFLKNGEIIEKIDDIKDLKYVKNEYSRALLDSVDDIDFFDYKKAINI